MMRNCYKREDVFICRHEMHRGFDYRVSAHHVLHEKKCYPHGCVDFVWKCKLLDKGGACPKGYRHVGNNCTDCRYYDEEKVHRFPELMISPVEYRAFERECRCFDDWLSTHEGSRWEMGGRVSDIRPYLVKRLEGRRTSLDLRGFVLRLEEGYVGLEGFLDPLYMRISGAQQKRHSLAVGDRVEAEAALRFDRGRLVGETPRRLTVEQRSGEAPARWEAALLDRLGAVSLRTQPQRCLHCERGVLVDVEDLSPGLRRRRNDRRREMLCLEGIGRPQDCPFEALKSMRGRVVSI